jgi:hypothetical protein
MQFGAHPRVDVVDVVDIDHRFGHEPVRRARHDIHDLVVALDHPADREHAEIDDVAGIGRADVGAVEDTCSVIPRCQLSCVADREKIYHENSCKYRQKFG